MSGRQPIDKIGKISQKRLLHELECVAPDLKISMFGGPYSLVVLCEVGDNLFKMVAKGTNSVDVYRQALEVVKDYQNLLKFKRTVEFIEQIQKEETDDVRQGHEED